MGTFKGPLFFYILIRGDGPVAVYILLESVSPTLKGNGSGEWSRRGARGRRARKEVSKHSA